MAIATLGTLSYNTITFSALHNSRIDAQTIYDESGRTRIAVEYTLTVHAWLSKESDASTLDEDFTAWRIALTEPGRELEYSVKGFGNVIVNNDNGGGTRDIAYGPKPELLSFVPIGNYAAFVDWRITFRIEECDTPRGAQGIVAHNWEVDTTIQEGLTVYTISGYVQIAASRYAGSRQVPDSAERLREWVTPDVPDGFERVSRYHLSKDKTRLDFTFTDTEKPYPLPPGCVKAEIEHTIETGPVAGGTFATGTWHTGIVSATLTQPAGRRNKNELFIRFIQILGTELRQAFQNVLTGNVGKLTENDLKNKPLLLVTGITIRAEMLGRAASFSVRYRVVGKTLTSLLLSSGIFEPIPGFTQKLWSASMRHARAFHPHGVINMKWREQDEIIIDLCADLGEPDYIPGGTSGGRSAGPGVSGTGFAREPGIGTGGGGFFSPDFLNFDVRMAFEENDHIAQHKPLTGAAGSNLKEQPVRPNAFGPPKELADSEEPHKPQASSKVKDQTQRVSAPTGRVHILIKGHRIGKRVPIPRVKTIAGVEATQVAQIIQNRIIPWGGVAIFETIARITYTINNMPAEIPVPSNPLAAEPGTWEKAGLQRRKLPGGATRLDLEMFRRYGDPYGRMKDLGFGP